MGGLQQTATALRASPDGHNVVVGPCLLTRTFLCTFPPPSAQGKSGTCTSNLPAPWAPTRLLLLAEGQPTGIRVLPTPIRSTGGASTCRRGHRHVPCQDPAGALCKACGFLLATATNLIFWATLFTTKVSFIHFIGPRFYLFNLVSLIVYFLANRLCCIYFAFLSPLPVTLPP